VIYQDILRCWRCDDSNKPARDPLGLCDDCHEWLQQDLTTPPKETARLLAPGHLPEEIPDQRGRDWAHAWS
jgi:hypothetical protein